MTNPVTYSIKEYYNTIKNKNKNNPSKFNLHKNDIFALNSWHSLKDILPKSNIHVTPFHRDYLLRPPLDVTRSNYISINLEAISCLKGKTNIESDFRNVFRPQLTDTLCFYTDGSKSENRVGYASVCPQLGWSTTNRISDHASIYTAESIAILKTLEHIDNP